MTCDLPAVSAVPQPTAPPSAPSKLRYIIHKCTAENINLLCVWYSFSHKRSSDDRDMAIRKSVRYIRVVAVRAIKAYGERVSRPTAFLTSAVDGRWVRLGDVSDESKINASFTRRGKYQVTNVRQIYVGRRLLKNYVSTKVCFEVYVCCNMFDKSWIRKN